MALRAKKSERGQAAVEFILISVVIFFFLFMLLSMSIVFVVSSYLDYATFMAARTYKTGASRQSNQEQAARNIFLAYFDKVNGIARNPQFEIVRTETNNVRTEGILTSWDIDLFYLPPVFLGANGPTSAIRLTSEAHLGRDPSSEECTNFFQSFLSRVGVSDPNSAYMAEMEDNGC